MAMIHVEVQGWSIRFNLLTCSESIRGISPESETKEALFAADDAIAHRTQSGYGLSFIWFNSKKEFRR